MVFEEEIEEMKKLEEEIRQQRIKKVKKKKKPNIKNIKRIKTTTYIIGIIVFIGIALLVYQYDKERKDNERIIKNNTQKIELVEIQKMKLWDGTIKDIRENNKYIEINYHNYKIKLDSEKLANSNKFAIKVENKVSNYQEWENQDILEVDVSQVQPYHLLEQIELNTNEWLKGWNKVDIYGIKAEDGKIEYIETKEIHKDNITLVLREEYEKYIFVYVPIQEIKVEEEI